MSALQRGARAFLASIIAMALPFASLNAVPRSYHLELEANPAAAFPSLSKFGEVDLHVYPGGVRADTIWLDAFSRTGSRQVTVENPLARLYTDVPIGQISDILSQLRGESGVERDAAPTVAKPVRGKVGGVDATRYRLVYGPQAWIDIWTTGAIEENRQLRAIVEEFAQGISPASATQLRSIPGTPLYVELNFRRFNKVPILRMKRLQFRAGNEKEALELGAFFFRAPFLEAIWK